MKSLIVIFIALFTLNTMANDCDCRDVDQLTEQLMASYDIDHSSVLEYQELMNTYEYLKSDIEKLIVDDNYRNIVADDVLPLSYFLFIQYTGRLPKLNNDDLNLFIQLSLRGLIDTSLSMGKKELKTTLNVIYCNAQ